MAQKSRATESDLLFARGLWSVRGAISGSSHKWARARRFISHSQLISSCPSFAATKDACARQSLFHTRVDKYRMHTVPLQKKLKILLVDDTSDNLVSLEAALSPLGQ